MKNESVRRAKTDRVQLCAGVSVLFALCYMLCIYAPVELYCYNQREFWFDLGILFRILLVLFLIVLSVSLAVAAVIYRLSPQIYRRVLVPAVVIAFVCTYVQGNFLVGNLPQLDGSVPDWNNYLTERIQSVILWIVVSIVVVVAYRLLKAERFAGVVKFVSICMILMLSVTLVSILFTTKGYEKKQDLCATTKEQTLFSQQENFFILIVDSADAGVFQEVLQEDQKYRDTFADFTFYENMMGAYPSTNVSIPYIVGGQWYENETSLGEYELDAFHNSPLLKKLEEEGYHLAMYSEQMPFEDEEVLRFSNVLCQNSRVNSYIEFVKLEIKLIGYRYAPFELKRKCLFDTRRFEKVCERGGEYPEYSQWNTVFYNRMKEAEPTLTQEKCFKLIHIDGPHVPYEHDEEVNEIEEGTYELSMKASITITRTFLDMLKDAGVYDNSVIIIMADHGMGETHDNGYGRQNPIFLAKGIGEKHELEVSGAPVSYEDLQEAFARLLQGKDSSEIFDYQEGDVRTRRYLFYDHNDYSHMYEYISTGHAADMESMMLTGNEYKNKAWE